MLKCKFIFHVYQMIRLHVQLEGARARIFAAHHGHRRRLAGVFHTRMAQSPHCLACWHGQNM
jgi:hypothetical protein